MTLNSAKGGYEEVLENRRALPKMKESLAKQTKMGFSSGFPEKDQNYG